MRFTQPLLFLTIAAAICINTADAQEADSTGLPGDQFSLEAAFDLFKSAASPEQFEKMLNTEGNDANNLDLNNDGQTDYIRVIDRNDGNMHVLVLQVAVSETEDQDIAVIEIEKTGDNTAVAQIIGDEDIYGEETIVEPAEADNAMITGSEARYAHGPAVEAEDGVIVNVWLWPSVRYIYAPGYAVWRSPFRWRAHPAWWRPWRPASYAVFYPRRHAYRPRYAVVHTRRVVRANAFYRPARVTSVTVINRNKASVGRYRDGRTVTRTTVEGPRGNVQATRKTTTVTGKRGNKVKHTKTKVRRTR